ncbi:MAG: 3-hydroxyacyl-ACP dehydratase FabZ [Synergistes sp.]|nr:3-hydroxyacyl-ACP dehydratase FabZ [Synergistes sp.]
MVLDINEILKFLPQRYPFLLVDRIENVVDTDDEKSVVGYKNVTYNEPFFQGHFPDEPVMPGVLILEAMGQVGAVLLKLQPEFADGKRRVIYLTSIDHVRFRKPVRPGDCLVTHAKCKKRYGDMGKFEFIATVDGEVVAEAEMGFVIKASLTLEAEEK